MVERFSKLLLRTAVTGCLLGAAATFYFLAGLAGYVGSRPLNLIVAAAVIGAALFFFYSFVDCLRHANWLARAVGIAILAVLAIEVMLCLLPPTARDELTHHLAIPKLYARAGRIIEVPFAPYAYYPMLLDMLYTPWIYWGYDSVPKLIHAIFGCLTGLCLCAYLARRMNATYGLLGFFFFISLPAVLRLSQWAYVDLGVTFYTTAALLTLLRWREENQTRYWLAIAALSAGFAVAAKPNGLVAFLLLAFILALAQDRRRHVGAIVSDLLLFGVFSALPCLPWFAKNWFQTGNPFFPLLAGFFSGGEGGGGIAVSSGSLGILAKRQLLYGESWWQIAALPLRVFVSGQDDNPQYFDGVLSPILILFLPWAFKGKWSGEKKLLMIFAVLFFAYALFLVDLRVRYILLVAPPLVALLVYGVYNLYLSMRQPALLIAVLLCFAGLHAFYLWRYFEAARPLGYLAGRESRVRYLTRALGEFPVYHFIDRELSASAKIYLLFVGRRAYYCEREYFHDGGELPNFLAGALQSAKDPTDIAAALHGKGITHLMVRDDLFARFLIENLDAERKALWNAFAARSLRVQFRARGYSLYELHA